MVDTGDALLDNGAFIEVGGDKVGGGADNLDAALERLVVRLGALEAGQEGVVNVDDAAAHGRAEARREDLHVAGENDELNVVLADQVEDLRLLLQLGVLVHGQVVEGNTVALSQGLVLWVVGDDERNLFGRTDFRLACVFCVFYQEVY